MKGPKLKRPRSCAAQESLKRKIIRDLWAKSPLGQIEAAAREIQRMAARRPVTEKMLERIFSKIKWEVSPSVQVAAARERMARKKKGG